jgi:hypothetical protein
MDANGLPASVDGSGNGAMTTQDASATIASRIGMPASLAPVFKSRSLSYAFLTYSEYRNADTPMPPRIRTI